MRSDWEANGDWYLLEQEFEKAKQLAEKKRDLIEELFSDLEEEKESEENVFEIDQYFQNRVQTRKGRVDQIRKEMETRLEMNSKFIKEIDSQISYAQFSLERFTGWGVGYNTGVDVKRNHLERQLQQFRTDRRTAELRTWEDLISLRKELREATEEYKGARRLGKM